MAAALVLRGGGNGAQQSGKHIGGQHAVATERGIRWAARRAAASLAHPALVGSSLVRRSACFAAALDLRRGCRRMFVALSSTAVLGPARSSCGMNVDLCAAQAREARERERHARGGGLENAEGGSLVHHRPARRAARRSPMRMRMRLLTASGRSSFIVAACVAAISGLRIFTMVLVKAFSPHLALAFV
jgi:hypothetical protein